MRFLQRLDQRGSNRFRRRVARSDLDDAWLIAICRCQYGSKVEILRQNDEVVRPGITHDDRVGRIDSSNIGPMSCPEPGADEERNPSGR